MRAQLDYLIDREAYHRWVDEPTDNERLASTFGAFGMPGRLDADGRAVASA